MGRGQFSGLGQGFILEGPDNPGPQAQGLRRQEQVLADVPGFHVGVADAPLPIPADAAAVFPGDHHHHRGLGHPILVQRGPGHGARRSPGATGVRAWAATS